MDPEDISNLASELQSLALAWLLAYPGPYAVLDQPMLDTDLPPSSVQFFLDLGADTLKIMVKYPSGAVKTGQVALT